MLSPTAPFNAKVLYCCMLSASIGPDPCGPNNLYHPPFSVPDVFSGRFAALFKGKPKPLFWLHCFEIPHPAKISPSVSLAPPSTHPLTSITSVPSLTQPSHLNPASASTSETLPPSDHPSTSLLQKLSYILSSPRTTHRTIATASYTAHPPKSSIDYK